LPWLKASTTSDFVLLTTWSNAIFKGPKLNNAKEIAANELCCNKFQLVGYFMAKTPAFRASEQPKDTWNRDQQARTGSKADFHREEW
jgi:hypothetical protein